MLDYARQNGLPEPDFDALLGSGFYGKAYGTSDPKVVLKLTRDNDEGLLMAAQAQFDYPGIVPCRGAIQFPRGEWAIWKEALDRVGYDAWWYVFREVYRNKGTGDPLKDWLDTVRMIEVHDPELGKSPVDALYDLAEMWPGLSAICETCVYLYDTFQVIPGDMHAENFGCWDNHDQLILFDAQMGAFAEKIDYESCGVVESNPRQAQGALTQMRPGTERVSRAAVLNEMIRQDRGSIGRYDQDSVAKIRRRWDRPLALPAGDYLRMWLPLSLLDYQTLDQSADVRRKRAREYAARGEEFPPILARYSERRMQHGPPTFVVANGNHRALAAALRGDRYIQAFVPVDHWVNWNKRTGASYQNVIGVAI